MHIFTNVNKLIHIHELFMLTIVNLNEISNKKHVQNNKTIQNISNTTLTDIKTKWIRKTPIYSNGTTHGTIVYVLNISRGSAQNSQCQWITPS